MGRISYHIYRPEKKCKGAVAVVHGMAEHSGRYEWFAGFLNQNGYGVVTYDLPGHGSAAGDKGYFGKRNGWDLLINSAVSAVRKTRKEFPDVPVFLFGHSMGSMICRCFLQLHDQEIDGLMLSGAPNWQKAGKAGIAIGRITKAVKGPKGHSRLMDQMVTGNFNRSVHRPRTKVDWLSYSRENVDSYIADELTGFGFTVNGYIDELTGMEQMHNSGLYRCRRPQLPIAFFAGEEDPCTGGTKGLADSVNTLRKAGYSDIFQKSYPHMRHEILNETGKEKVGRDMVKWFDGVMERIGKQKKS